MTTQTDRQIHTGAAARRWGSGVLLARTETASNGGTTLATVRRNGPRSYTVAYFSAGSDIPFSNHTYRTLHEARAAL
jgi:hypothetical protein